MNDKHCLPGARPGAILGVELSGVPPGKRPLVYDDQERKGLPVKRIYFTAVPLQSNFIIQSVPVNPVNFTLDSGIRQAAFPIVPVVDATLGPEDEGVIVAVRQYNSPDNRNMDILRGELEALGKSNWTIKELTVPERQDKDLLLGLFSAMIGCLEDDACYYACMTFGTKTYPVVLFSVLSYAEKIRRNTQISGIYYCELLRRAGVMQQSRLYDVTALFTLNSVVDLVAGMDCENKDKMIETMLEL